MSYRTPELLNRQKVYLMTPAFFVFKGWDAITLIHFAILICKRWQNISKTKKFTVLVYWHIQSENIKSQIIIVMNLVAKN